MYICMLQKKDLKSSVEYVKEASYSDMLIKIINILILFLFLKALSVICFCKPKIRHVAHMYSRLYYPEKKCYFTF